MTRYFKVSLMKGSVLRFTKIVYFLSGYNKTGFNCSWGKNCLKLSLYFFILLLLSPLAYKCWPSFELIKLNSFYLKILCVNFGWILPRFWRKDIWTFSLCKLLYQQFRVNSRKLRVNSRKFRVISRKLRVNSRKFRVISRYFAKVTRLFAKVSRYFTKVSR